MTFYRGGAQGQSFPVRTKIAAFHGLARVPLLLSLALACATLWAQYLPHPILVGGDTIQAENWDTRRDHLRQSLTRYQYGEMPPPGSLDSVTVDVTAESTLLDGAAERKDLNFVLHKDGQQVTVRAGVIYPVEAQPAPVVIKNDRYRWSLDDMAEGAKREKYRRGGREATTQWVTAELMKSGYAYVKSVRDDVVPDRPDSDHLGVKALFPDYSWGHIAAWAWMYGVIIDWLEDQPFADPERIVATGHSRGGKVALCAGVYDDRIAVTAPNSSGAGGTASWRHFDRQREMQTLAVARDRHRYWYTDTLFSFVDCQDALPVDAHIPKLLIAPRALINTHARQDYWANPYGTRLTHLAARPIYAAYGVPERLALHWRDGGHNQGMPDWRAMLDFCDRLFYGKPTERNFDLNPHAHYRYDSILDPYLAAFRNFGSLEPEGVYFTNGFRVAELTADGAIVWTRLCGQQQPNPITHRRKPKVFRHPLDFDETMPVSQMDGAVSGAAGYVRIGLRGPEGNHSSGWRQVGPDGDYTLHAPFDDLLPDTEYHVTLEGRSLTSDTVEAVATGPFRTPPPAGEPAPVRFTTSTCQYFWSYDDTLGFQTYLRMAELDPDFFVQTGDYVYYDKPGPHADTPQKARHKWHAINGWPSLRAFYRSTPTYLIKDDHDLLSDDVDPTTEDYGELSLEEGLRIWRENVPLRDRPFRSFRWGRDLQVWLLEGREYRAANAAPDDGDKSILGQRQRDWLRETLDTSGATFKVIVSATPVVGPDRETKTDNHANRAFAREGDWLRDLLSGHRNTYVINGDRHWQYASRDAETGLREFGSGPVSDSHVQGWQGGKQPEHVYLNLIGGFLEVEVGRREGVPRITFTHRDTQGGERHTETFIAN